MGTSLMPARDSRHDILVRRHSSRGADLTQGAYMPRHPLAPTARCLYSPTHQTCPRQSDKSWEREQLGEEATQQYAAASRDRSSSLVSKQCR